MVVEANIFQTLGTSGSVFSRLLFYKSRYTIGFCFLNVLSRRIEVGPLPFIFLLVAFFKVRVRS